MALQLDRQYDVAFPCPQCDFVARGPTPLEEHLRTHESSALPPEPEPEIVRPESVDAVRVVEPVGPVTPAVQRVGARAYTCAACSEKVVGFFEFMEHKKIHRKEQANE